jgi:nucleoside-diphosphate-sugar epimerase
MKKTLVTGGAGFIGFQLAKYLQNLNYNITIIDDFSRGHRDNEFEDFIRKNNIKCINADMREKSFYKNLDAYYDQIYHLAAINGTKNFYEHPEKVLEVNILSLINILSWVDANNCGKFIFSSSSEAYAGTIIEYGNSYNYIPTDEKVPLTVNNVFNPRFSYGGSKLIGEILTVNLLNSKKVNYSIVRYHNIYGERMGFDHVIPEFCKRIYDKVNPFPIFGGDETRAFCHVMDGVKATVAVMETGKTNGHIVHIGNSIEEIKIRDMANILLQIAKYYPNIEVQEAPAGSVKRRCPNTEKLKTLTNFSPEVMLAEGLQKTYDWYIQYLRKSSYYE